MRSVPRLVSSTLALEVVDVLIANGQRTVLMIESMLKVVDDGIARGKAMSCEGTALRPVGSDDKRRTRNFARIGTDVRVRAIADTRTQSIRQIRNVFFVSVTRLRICVPRFIDLMIVVP